MAIKSFERIKRILGLIDPSMPIAQKGGREAIPYKNDKYFFKIIEPSHLEGKPPTSPKTSFAQLSAAEQTARNLVVFHVDHENIAKSLFAMPFWKEDASGGKPFLFVIQQRIKPKGFQPRDVYDITQDKVVRRDGMNIDPKVQDIFDDTRLKTVYAFQGEISPLLTVIYSLVHPKGRMSNIIRTRDGKDGKSRDVIVDGLLSEKTMLSQVREACRKTGKCGCDWKKYVENAKAGFGRIPNDLSLKHVQKIPEIAPILPEIKRHIEERDRKKSG